MSGGAVTSLEIERVVAGGDGLARHDGLVAFVPRALAGERVRARLALRGRLARAELVGVDRPSPARVDPACAHYDGDQCGGCQLQHASYAEQLRIKGAVVADAFRRIAHREVAPPSVRAAAHPWRYRRKLTLALRRAGDSWIAGLRRRGAPDEVFALVDCLITAESVLHLWKHVLAASHLLPAATALRGTVRVDANNDASLYIEGGQAWPNAADLLAAVDGLTGLWWKPVHGQRRRIVAPSGPGTPRATPAATAGASFTQVNETVAAELHEFVAARVRTLAPAHVVDAYAGVGRLAVACAAFGARVTAIESDPDAVDVAAAQLSAPSVAIAARVEDALEAALPADVVVLNPPRTGLDSSVCEVLDRPVSGVRTLIYVSCDPATLARDLSRLPSWDIVSLECFDMFPQTAHVETVCELARAAA